jgi:GH43 family beta-xylosidase
MPDFPTQLRKLLFFSLLFGQLLPAACSKNTTSPASNQFPPVSDSARYTFTNPIASGADPWVIKQGADYVFCATGGGGISVSRSGRLTQPGTPVRVWSPPATGWNRTNIWAPELHYLDGKWYIYYAAGEAGPPFIHQRAGVLESVSGDPQGEYLDKGMLYTGDDISNPAGTNKWAIDLTVFRLNSQLYAVWSGWEENAATDRTPQHLYIARMSNPWTISSNRVKLSSPEETWERGTELDLNEGPQVLKKGEKIFVIYSTRESWLKYYRLGQLTLNDTLQNPMNAASWTKTGPVFTGTETVHGVGHASFTTSPDGTEDWIVYHAKKDSTPGWNRDVRTQPFTWTADGFPDFGTPVNTGVPIPRPSGEQ